MCNNTNGLGPQTKTLLSALTRHGEELTRLIGPFDVHVACPQPGPDTWAFNPADLAFSQQVVASWGGLVHALRYKSAAYERVRAERDVVHNLAETLAFFWPSWDQIQVPPADLAPGWLHDRPRIVVGHPA